MKRLRKENKNTPDEYDRIFEERKFHNGDWSDLRRWKKLLRYYKGGKLVDLGCLDSNIPLITKTIFFKAEIWGIDLAEGCIKEMKKRHPEINYEVRDLYKTGFKDNSFDYAILGEVLEHLEEPKTAIKEAMRILKPGGWVAISTPLNEAREPGAVDGDRHIWSFTIKDMSDLLKPYGRVKIERLGSKHFPIYQYQFPALLAYCKKK